VEQGCRIEEADETGQTVGKGGLPDRDGNVTLDACIMDKHGNCGAVVYLQNVVHAVSVARKVMEETPHVILAGKGAEQFAYELGFPKENLLTDASKKAWEEWKKTSEYKPIINIDHQANNEHYGQINIIELPASTSAEIIFDLLQKSQEELLNRHIAQSLLTGIIAGTNSFKKNKVRPQTLQVASKLVDLGADRAFIIKNLYQTKSIATFKIWGSVLSHLKESKEHNFVWSTITRDDFTRSGAVKEDLNNIIDELITTSPSAQFVLLLNEDPLDLNNINGTLRILPQNHATEIMKKYAAEGDENETKFEISGKIKSHATHMRLCHIAVHKICEMSHVTHMNESCHTYEGAMSHI
jgi:hypothetical protein